MSRPLLTMVCVIGKVAMIQANCFNTTPAPSMLNLLQLTLINYLGIKYGHFQSVAELQDAEHAKHIKRIIDIICAL